MLQNNIILKISLALSILLLVGCASVPMASLDEDKAKKQFLAPEGDNAGIYIYRNSNFAGALKKSVYVDGQFIGETAPMTYFYKKVEAGKHTLSTESEFSNNDLIINVKAGVNYFVRQFMKLGFFVGGAGLEQVSEATGKNGVLETKLAK